MALRKGAGYIALHPVTICTDHQSLQSWHEEYVNTPSGPASCRGRWHETLAKFDLAVVYVPGKKNTVADRLSMWAIQPAGAWRMCLPMAMSLRPLRRKKNIDMERMMGEDDVKCFVVMDADDPLGRGLSRAVRVLALEGTESNKHLVPESFLQDAWTDAYAKSEAFEFEYPALTDPDNGQKWPKGHTEEDGKVYRNSKMLVLESRVLEVCKAWHHQMIHRALRT